MLLVMASGEEAVVSGRGRMDSMKGAEDVTVETSVIVWRFKEFKSGEMEYCEIAS